MEIPTDLPCMKIKQMYVRIITLKIFYRTVIRAIISTTWKLKSIKAQIAGKDQGYNIDL